MKNILWKDRKRTFLGLPWSFTVYELDEERFMIKTGFFTKKEDEVRLYRIMDVSLKRTLGQRIFGLGTITCVSADRSLGNFEIKNIKNSRDVKEMLSDNVEIQRDKKRVTNREFMSGHDHDFDDHDFDHDHDDYDDDDYDHH